MTDRQIYNYSRSITEHIAISQNTFAYCSSMYRCTTNVRK